MSAADLKRLLKDENVSLGNHSSTIPYKMEMMEQAVTDTVNPVNITIFDLESRSDRNTKIRDLLNNGLYQSVKKQNEKTVKTFIE